MNFVFNQSGDGNTQIGSIGKTNGPEWVRTADRLPTEADGYVIGLEKGMFTEELVPFATWWSALNKKTAIYWQPLPKLPEVEG